jgi:endonuclease YncB( thermonuclease family)
MIFRIAVLSLALLIGIGALVHLTTHNSEASAPLSKILKTKKKKYKKYSKQWWRAYHSRIRKKKALEARNRMLRLRRIRLANGAKIPVRALNQKTSGTVPAILVNNMFILVEGKVKDVFDGESFNLETKDGKFYLIRMLGIDAPELNQNFGSKSQKKLSQLILGKNATVIIRKRDSAGQYLGTIYSGGEDINLLQIETGMAWFFRQGGYQPVGPDLKLYEQAEKKARSKRKGLWRKQPLDNSLALKR